MELLKDFIPTDKLRFNEDGTYRIKKDEFEIDGKPYCRKCKEPRFFEATRYGYPNFRTGCACSCQNERDIEQEKFDLQMENARRHVEEERLSVLGNYANKTWEDIKIDDTNRAVVEKCKAYVENSDVAIKKNAGLYIYGMAGVGKSLCTAIMCMELVKKGHRCLYTNISKLISFMNNFDNFLKEDDVLKKLLTYDFIFIDDFGTELIGTDKDGSYTEKKLFQIIDAREKSGKPIVLTSNYTIQELGEKHKLDTRVNDRLIGMCKRYINFTGKNHRV